MKKIISLALVLCLIFSLTVLADEGSDVKEVLSLIKGRLPDTDGFLNFESSKRQSGNIETYTFMWYSNEEPRREMSVRTTKSGIILSYNYYTEEKESLRPTVKRPLTEEFLEKAKELSEKINPTIKDKIEVSIQNKTESLYGGDYYYNLTHVENSIPVYGNTGTLVISSDGETLRSYSLNYDEGAVYENPEKIIGEDKAKEAFYSEIGMNIEYRTKYDGKERNAYLSYRPKISYGTYIEAFTGKAITPETYEGGAYKTMNSAAEESVMMDGSGSSVHFSEAELNEFEKLTDLMGRAKAEKTISDSNLLKVADAKVESFSTSRDYYEEDKYYHNLTYRSNDFYARVKLDAKTGKIYSFYQSDDFYKGDKEIGLSKANGAIDKALEVLCSDEIKDGGSYRIKESGDTYTRIYQRHVNDIPYENDYINITVSKKDGSLVNYSYSYTDIEFPSPEGVITEKEAAYKLIEQKEYIPFYYISKNKEKNEIKTNLIYMFTESPFEIDAFTGELKNPYARVEIPEYEDINGHFSENAVKTLARFGIGFNEKFYRPDDLITQKEYISLLTMAIMRNQGIILTKDYDAKSLYNYAYNSGILAKDEMNENAVVSRLDGAVYFIRALGMDEVASLKDIFSCPFTDVDKNAGHVSILYGLGVIKGDGLGNFNPEKTITRGEAAVMIYNYLAR